VNGAKKWITNGIFADYCTAAVRTGGVGIRGISALVIPLKTPGVTCRKIRNSGVEASGMYSSLLIVVHMLIPGRLNVHRVRSGEGPGSQLVRAGKQRLSHHH
jgi:alkylation response protein AidB-like acyl-CoA dehydrogenase